MRYLLLCTLMSLLCGPCLAHAQTLRLLVPAYFPVPEGKKAWFELIDQHRDRESELIAIANVGLGSGAKQVGGGPFIPQSWDVPVTRSYFKEVLGHARK